MATLREQYVSKMGKLRTPAVGERLVFSADGALTAGEPGPWSTAGHVTIRALSANENTVFIEGERAFLVYDTKEKRYRDFFEVVGNDDVRGQCGIHGIGKKDREWFEKQKPVRIAVSFAGDPRAVLEKVLELDEDLHWPPPKEAPSANKAAGVGRGVSARRVLWSPNPRYTDFAKRAQLQGTSILWVVIGPDGLVKDMRVQRPLGLASTRRPWRQCGSGSSSPRRKTASPSRCK
ncbi:MAG TPA: energy transducer TonB [Terriglobales bacterium]|nr:energy transducer TonB [Terriglobales bacterium]